MVLDALEVPSGGTSAPPPATGGTGRARPWWMRLREANPAVVFVLSALSGLIVSSIIIVVSIRPARSAWSRLFSDPLHALSETGDVLNRAYSALLSGSLGSPSTFATAFGHPSVAHWSAAFVPLGHTLTAAVPLVVGGLGLSIAYRSGVFSIGAQAQMIAGAVAASWVGFSWPGLPAPLHVAIALLAAIVGGAVLGLIPGVLKVRTGASEVIVTIMLNYVMANLLVYLISNTFFSQKKGASPVGRLTLPSGTLPSLFGHRAPIDAGVLVAVVVLAFGWLLMTRSRIGFEFELAGMSPGVSRTAGIDQRRTFVAAFVVSGGIVGLAGAVQVLGATQQLQSGFGGDVGVLAIAVAFVGRNRPLGITLAALLYGVLQTGGLHMQGVASVSYQLSNVIEGVIVLFMVAPGLVAELYRLRPAVNGGLRSLTLSRGWGR